ncbi:hypothetical protein [Planktothrix agardhii]|jgi:hypothetical protein|uniref:hypothetical protein n=1 Tax=Planktothrix agardhii TaxID=1160 RepID=UPI0020A8115B|nr:hypothetical protein [Planktothrix agardhii]CAD5984855.1 hypothetical protein NO365_04433 [Planktothrix agardhii]
MANLIYNGQKIAIEQDGRVNITELYKAAGKPSNQEPTKFRTSKKAEIQEYMAKQGTWVLQTRRGSKTLAIVPLAYIYLKECIKDPGAAEALQKVADTEKDIKYNSRRTASDGSPTPPSDVSSSSDNELPGWIMIVIICIIMIAVSQQPSPQQTPQVQPSSPPSQYRPLSP